MDWGKERNRIDSVRNGIGAIHQIPFSHSRQEPLCFVLFGTEGEKGKTVRKRIQIRNPSERCSGKLKIAANFNLPC